ncbi:MAG: hypothetical protein FJY85_11920, partial [Deltaproteobacteria bacterium]|nr:hypothetical protein [Deltaproteobacteria bacterium]
HSMITDDQEKDILARAYVPEHCVRLMTLVSGGEPFVVDDYFCCRTRDLVIVVGYPLNHEFRTAELEALRHTITEMFDPAILAIIAPDLPESFSSSCRERESDWYYTLDLQGDLPDRRRLRQATKAGREATVERGRTLVEEHRRLALEFAERIDPPPRIREFLFGMWSYVGKSDGSVVLNAWRRDGELAAFYVVDVSAFAFATYIIGCHSKANYVAGASDLLFLEMIEMSRELDKKYVHLGLGVNEGIRRFKKKWGGVPTLKYEMCELALKRRSFLTAIASYWGPR